MCDRTLREGAGGLDEGGLFNNIYKGMCVWLDDVPAARGWALFIPILLGLRFIAF
jgi:hypothetical protein